MFIGIIPVSPLVKFCKECSKNKFIFHFLILLKFIFHVSVLLKLFFANLREIKENCEYFG